MKKILIGVWAAILSLCLVILGYYLATRNRYQTSGESTSGDPVVVNNTAEAPVAANNDPVVVNNDSDVHVVKEDDSDEIRVIKNDTKSKSSAKPSIRLCPQTPDTSGMYQLPVSAAKASSTIDQSSKNVSNYAMYMFDGNDQTSWQEGVSGYGIGENIDIFFEDKYEINYIGFKFGNWKNDKYYYGNAKPKTLFFEVDDVKNDDVVREQVEFPNSNWGIDWVEVKNIKRTDHMKLTIVDVYPGTSYEDTCITDILVFGKGR
ncbi:MAG: hypothetical protein IJ679_08390 [Lachnospiraceae bacterium]|nr:hypothetical protein [Lachnospiraceae bacterium]